MTFIDCLATRLIYEIRNTPSDRNMNATTKSNTVHCTSFGNAILPMRGIQSSNNAIESTFTIFMLLKNHGSSANI